VPPGTQPGTVLRFAGHGLPRPGGGQQGANGDLYVVVDVVIPATLSSGERRMYEQLRAASRPARRPWHWRRRRAAKEPPPPPPA
jgi:molecular chaperone DnaJ